MFSVCTGEMSMQEHLEGSHIVGRSHSTQFFSDLEWGEGVSGEVRERSGSFFIPCRVALQLVEKPAG